MKQNGWIDLHVHTAASDGTMTPSETVRHAKQLGLAAIAITDHDTAAGVAEARRAGEQYDVEVVGGIELSSEYRGFKLHVLGYFIDPEAPALEEFRRWAAGARDARNERIVAMLAEDGYDISMQALRESYPDAVIGMPHMAEYLMKQCAVPSVKEAFDMLFGDGCKYYLPKPRLPLDRAQATILGAGGVPVLAHPLIHGYPIGEVRTIAAVAADLGFVGLEAFYSEYTPEQTKLALELAAENGLLPTGGSDFHGTRKPHIEMGTGMGNLHIPYEVLEQLKQERDRMFEPAQEPVEEETLTLDELCRKLCAAADRLTAAKDELNELDRRSGDGDHGTTMEKIADAIRFAVDNSWEWHTVGELMGAVASNIMMIRGGMGGRLWYAFFDGMARSMPNGLGLSDRGIRRLFAAGVNAVTDVTPAQVGGRTLLDALIPAVNAMQDVDGSAVILASAAAAAEAGARATAQQLPMYGAARRFGDLCLGVCDPGAVSMARFFAGLSEG